MLTKVILEGAMGKKFGREWELAVNSANEALSLIDANIPGVFVWIRNNLKIYQRYKVICEYANGLVEELTEKDYTLQRKPTLIRFVPHIEGAGEDAGQFIAGLVLTIAGAVLSYFDYGTFGSQLMSAGIAMMVGGVIQMLTPQPKMDKDESERKDKTSYYFDGPVNTSNQGVPVQLIYGRCLVGSHPISASVTVDQLI